MALTLKLVCYFEVREVSGCCISKGPPREHCEGQKKEEAMHTVERELSISCSPIVNFPTHDLIDLRQSCANEQGARIGCWLWLMTRFNI